MRRTAILVMLLLVLLTACSGSERNCDRHPSQYEEVTTYDSGSYHSRTYWYWCSGYSMTYTWDDDVYDSCDVSRYTFNPIC